MGVKLYNCRSYRGKTGRWDLFVSAPILNRFNPEGNNQALLQPFVSSYDTVKKKVSAFGKVKITMKKENFLQQIFFLPTKFKKNVHEECQENHDSDNFSDDTKSVMCNSLKYKTGGS